MKTIRGSTKYLYLIMIMSMLSITACGSTETPDVASQEEIDTSEITESEDKRDYIMKDNNKGREIPEISTEDINADNASTYKNEENEDINTDFPDNTTGKVVNTDGIDGSIYEELDDPGYMDEENVIYYIYNDDPDGFLNELSVYINDIYSIDLSRIMQYTNDDEYTEKFGNSVSYNIQELQYKVQQLSTKDYIIKTYFNEDTELVTAWSNYFEAVNSKVEQIQNLTESNTKGIDTTDIGKATTDLATVLSTRIVVENTEETESTDEYESTEASQEDNNE